MLDLKNKKFNRLTALRPVGRTKQRLVIWECRCDCGKIKRVIGNHLRRGSTKSCGCFKAENLHKEGQAHHGWNGYHEISRSFYSRMKDAADLRKWEWEVSIEFLWQLFIKQNRRCALSGRIIKMPIHIRNLRDKNNDDLASLDRIDSNRGYTQDNVQWVCKRVNYMKNIMTQATFLEYVKDIFKQQKLYERNPNKLQ